MQQRHSYLSELTKQDIRAQKSENIIKKDFTATEPSCKCLTDITVECKDGKLYINPVLECYNGEIIGLAMDDNMKATLCCNAIDNAYKETGAKKELLYIVMLVNALITQEW